VSKGTPDAKKVKEKSAAWYALLPDNPFVWDQYD
jgi:hypothetical protein